MIITNQRARALIIFAGFGIFAPNLLIALIFGSPQPAAWPAPARMIDLGIALTALVSVVFPQLLDD